MQTTNCNGVTERLQKGPVDRALDNSLQQVDPCLNDGIVSFQVELPLVLQKAMTGFIERHPNWDQYRLIQAALAGFLVQNGVVSRSITRLYVGKMFNCDALS